MQQAWVMRVHEAPLINMEKIERCGLLSPSKVMDQPCTLQNKQLSEMI